MNDRPTRSTPATGTPAKGTPARKATPGEVATTPATAADSLWSRVRANPGYAPELLARSAVTIYGPVARAWVDRTRGTYPDAAPDALARLVAALQARLTPHIAAAYGTDPAHPDRAADLLVLTRVHPDAETARAALDSTEPTAAERALADVAWRAGVPLLRIFGGWAARRALARLVPGAALVWGATAGADALRGLAARAVLHYR